MKRAVLFGLVLVALAGTIPGQSASAQSGALARDLADLVGRPVQFPGIEGDEKIPLGAVLDLLAERYEVTFLVDEAAFQAEALEDVLATRAFAKTIPAMRNSRLAAVLNRVLGRLPVESGATFLLRSSHIEISTVAAARAEIWGPDYQGPFLPLVSHGIARRSLRRALAELAERADFNVVLDVRVGDKAELPVSATFMNTPLDTAVRLLADMAGLRTTLNDNVLFVTTEKQAVKLRPNPDDVSMPPTGGFGLGLGGYRLDLYYPIKRGTFERRPVQDALRDALDTTTLRLVIDTARIGDKAKAPVTANLEGATVDTAVRLLADLADLKAVVLDNVVYLTTRENARALLSSPDRPTLDRLPLQGGVAAPAEDK